MEWQVKKVKAIKIEDSDREEVSEWYKQKRKLGNKRRTVVVLRFVPIEAKSSIENSLQCMEKAKRGHPAL
ncbi:uncharacterized protein HKW66_Vig0215880 [Vigna angularis]|uniref:Uncharacterized protein n=1 Tax=Phaseolus angularis TaxID=3914 RepID=A0A8T0JFZ2_PHAAN|nr:uncharacterized protein HKW66_Vig0215880 [Vigna angularis]